MKKETNMPHSSHFARACPARFATVATLGLLATLIAPLAHAQAAATSVSRDVPAVVVGDTAAAANPQALHPLPTATPAPADSSLADPTAPDAPRVGDATRRLLALQRSGEMASNVPRPIAGDVAQRSRERYLKSFEREIPERFQSSVNGGSGQSSGR